MRVALFQSLYAGLLATYAAMVLAWTWAIGRLRSGQPLFPPIKPRIVPWGAPSTGAVIFVWIFARLLAGDAFVALTGHPRAVPLSFLEQMTLASMWACLILVTVPLVLVFTSRASVRDFGLEPRGFIRQAAFGAMAFLLVAVPIYLINFLSVSLTSLFTKAWEPNKHPVEKMVRENFGGEVAYLAVLSAVFLAPAAEELIFRGVIQSWLFKAFRGLRKRPVPHAEIEGTHGSTPIEVSLESRFHTSAPEPDRSVGAFAGKASVAEVPDRCDRRAEWAAIVLTSLLFGLAHWEQWPAPVAIFFLSLSLGFVFQRSGSLWSSFVLHALFNGLSTTVLFWSILGSEPPAKKAEFDDPRLSAPARDSAPPTGPPKPAPTPP